MWAIVIIMLAQSDYMQVLSMPVKIVPCSSESRELRAPILKGEVARDSWLIWDSWFTSKDLFSSVRPCQTDCVCGLGLSCTLPRDLWVPKLGDTHIRSLQNQKLAGGTQRDDDSLAPPGRSWLGISEMDGIWIPHPTTTPDPWQTPRFGTVIFSGICPWPSEPIPCRSMHLHRARRLH